ncbi:hypothetical protein ACFFLM_25970 [Deinococcus oregonensis]|uniref:OmpR/PhoB-type domain-containing protein n=1 Tax=Deinococcus oregonensis TaxID=1805970 RepID=A0ABV6BAF9_9DEIO
MTSELFEPLQQRIERAGTRRGSLTLALIGEPGSGKTFLTQRLVREMKGLTVSLHTRNFERGFAELSTVPGAPIWAQRTLTQSVEGRAPEVGMLAAAVGTLLGRAAPATVLAEDFHEADERTAEFWVTLARSLLRARGTVLLLTSRTALPEPFVPVRMPPLGLQASRALLEEQAGGALPEAALAWIGTRGQGNPLFLLEFFRHLTRSGALYADGSRWRWREPEGGALLPTTVEALAADHLSRVAGTEGEELLGVWALWSSALPAERLPAASAALLSSLPLETVRRLETSFQENGLLNAGEFTHPLFREVALGEQPYRKRRDLARRCLELLQGDPERAARFLPWAELPASQATRVLERALWAAQAQEARQRVAEYRDQLADLVPMGDRARAALEAATALEPLHLERALARATQARQLDPLHPQALYLCAKLLARSARGQDAERLLEDAPAPLLERADYWAALIETRVHSTNYAGALEVWNAQRARLEQLPLVRAQVATAQLRMGEVEAAVREIGRALAQDPDPAERATLLHALARNQTDRADQRMFATLGQAIAASAEAGLTSLQVNVLLDRARVLTWALQVHAAKADAQEAVQLAEGLGDPRLLARAQSELASALLMLGEYETAEELLLETLDLLGSEQASLHTILTQLYLTNLYLEWARPQDGLLALRHARQGLRLTRDVQDLALLTWFMSVSAWTEAMYGDPGRAEAQIAEGEALITESGQQATSPFYLFARGFLRERRGDLEGAAAQFDAACQLGQSLRIASYAARFGLEADRLRGDRQTAEARLAFFESHALVGFARTVRHYFPVPFNEPDQGSCGLEAEPDCSAERSLCLEVLGEVRVTRAGEPLPERSPRGLRLLVRLLEARLAGRPGVRQDELLETLYPDDDPGRSAVRLRQQVRRLRQAFGTRSVLLRGSGYALGDLDSDAEIFLRTRDAALWRGPYLADFGEELELSGARDVLSYGLRLAAFEAERHAPQEAARLGQILLEMDPFDWAALSLSLRSLRETGDLMTVLSLYARTREQCSLLGEPLPASWEDYLNVQELGKV